MTLNFDFDDYDNNGEDYCPLCIEEMDLSDKKFFPCPCGYQICQFCYNNIRQNPDLNGRCPACRRKYDDVSVTYIELTPEEIKADHARKASREKSRKHREKERKEQESMSRKHLAGVRVIQKNLVYIVGLNPTVQPEELQSLLRSDKFFGQFGKIMKVVVNKRNQNANSVGNTGYGIYITFARKEDAEKCIRDVDGSIMDGKVIRAAYGTTKYCSSYLKGLACPNPNCMFLHEPGEEAETHRQETHNSNETNRHHEGGIIRYSINHGSNSSSRENHEEIKPALPATASWAKTGFSTSNDSKPKSQGLANNQAFPTLAEIALSRNGSNISLTGHKEKKKEKEKKKDKDITDKFTIDESNSTQFMTETLNSLKTCSMTVYKFDSSQFEKKYSKNPNDFPSLFGFVSSNGLESRNSTEPADVDFMRRIFIKLNAESFLTSHRLFENNSIPRTAQAPIPAPIYASPPPGLQPPHIKSNSQSSEILSHLLNGKKP